MSLHILLVEDESTDRIIFESAQKHVAPDLKYSMAADGKDALDMLNDGLAADIILVDIRMPRLDGKSLIKHIRATEKIAAKPVIVMSTSDNPTEVRECYLNGANAYFVKPAGFDAYCQMLRRLLNFWNHTEMPSG